MVNVLNMQPNISIMTEVTCKACGADLQYAPIEMEQHKHTDHSGTSELYYTIKCPVCTNELEVNQK